MEKTRIPDAFKSLLWSYDFSKIDPEKDKKTIIVNTINYGDLPEWQWLIRTYGKETLQSILESIPATELRPRARRLAEIIFSLHPNTYASRGTHS